MSARSDFAEILWKLKARELPIDDFEKEYFKISRRMKVSRDPDRALIKDIFMQAWQLYDDLADDYLSIENCTSQDIERWLCFLRSNRKYEWPQLGGGFVFLNCIRRWRLMKYGDLESWPFLTCEEYVEERKASAIDTFGGIKK